MSLTSSPRALRILWLSMLLVSFGGFGLTLPAGAGGVVNSSWLTGTAIEGYDPVAYFTESRPVEGASAFSHDWMGVTWYFASAENRVQFAAEPERYAPQYGGYCAWAVAHGYTAKIDPKAWKIVDGKLYACSLSRAAKYSRTGRLARCSSVHATSLPSTRWKRLALASTTLASTAKPLALDQPGCHAPADDAFEHLAQDVTVAEAAITIDRKGGMVGYVVLEPEPAEPPIGKVELDLTTEPALGADRVAVADQEHPDHQLGIDRRTFRGTVELHEADPQPAQIENGVDPAQQRSFGMRSSRSNS